MTYIISRSVFQNRNIALHVCNRMNIVRIMIGNIALLVHEYRMNKLQIIKMFIRKSLEPFKTE